MQSQVTVIISTIGDRSEPLLKKDFACKKDIILVHQRANDLSVIGSFGFKKYIALDRNGLSASRNCGLNVADSKFAHIMDDDVEFNLSDINQVAVWMNANNVDVATCCFQFDDGTFPKKYKDSPFKHNIITAAGVSSIELCVNVESIKSCGIFFDEQFGLGTALPSGEEYIFVTDCIKAGLNVWFYPIVVGIHPKVTSGMDFYSTPAKVLAKRKMLIRIFGKFAFLFIFIFWVKKIPKVIGRGHFMSFTMNLLFGGKPC